MIKKTLCFSNRAQLCCRNRQLIIRVDDPVTGKPLEHSRPIEDIGVVVIESEQVTLSSYLISALLENKVASRPLKKHRSSQSTKHYVGCPKGRHSEWPAIGRNVLIKIFSRMEEHPHDS